MKVSIFGHFRHYYGNIPLGLAIGLLYDAITEKSSAIEADYMELRNLIMTAKAPLAFIDSHEALPKFETLPEEVKEVVREAEKAMKKMQGHFTDALDAQLKALVAAQQWLELRAFFEAIDALRMDFSAKYHTLKKFPEKY